MKAPRWLAQEIEDVARRVKSGELERGEAIGQLTDRIMDKDEELARGVTAEWVRGELAKEIDRLARLAAKETKRKTNRQGTFDEECSYFFPPDTFPPTTLLTEAEAHAEDLFGRAGRHYKVATDRMQFTKRLKEAVGGNQDGKATLAQAISALRSSGDTAAEG